jgi:hypothetical protein
VGIEAGSSVQAVMEKHPRSRSSRGLLSTRSRSVSGSRRQPTVAICRPCGGTPLKQRVAGVDSTDTCVHDMRWWRRLPMRIPAGQPRATARCAGDGSSTMKQSGTYGEMLRSCGSRPMAKRQAKRPGHLRAGRLLPLANQHHRPLLEVAGPVEDLRSGGSTSQGDGRTVSQVDWEGRHCWLLPRDHSWGHRGKRKRWWEVGRRLRP